MKKNKLTNLNIGEVSLVDKGAIGEVFTVIKSESEDSSLVSKYNQETIIETLKNMSNDEFSSVMKQMMSKYNEINEGGSTMGEEAIKKLLEEFMTPINKNFAELNKTIDELQKAQQTSEEKAKADAEAKAKADEESKKAEETKKAEEEAQKACNANEEMKKSFDAIANTLATLTKAMAPLSELGNSVSDISERIKKMEETPNPSNVQKSTTAEPGKEGEGPIWKSIIQPQVTE